jgi:hypothetical protein
MQRDRKKNKEGRGGTSKHRFPSKSFSVLDVTACICFSFKILPGNKHNIYNGNDNNKNVTFYIILFIIYNNWGRGGAVV